MKTARLTRPRGFFCVERNGARGNPWRGSVAANGNAAGKLDSQIRATRHKAIHSVSPCNT
jgi:hypothetical protein